AFVTGAGTQIMMISASRVVFGSVVARIIEPDAMNRSVFPRSISKPMIPLVHRQGRSMTLLDMKNIGVQIPPYV
ncbi:MAG TPA: hypothetical protein PKX11_02505, partial [Methanospirillum sp.]|nr:hypothetical protein [Methanospirillum sp.]